MMTFLGILLSLVSLAGYTFSAHCLLKVPFRLSPLFSVCLVMIVLFWAALAKMLLPATLALLAIGGLLCAYIVILKGRGGAIIDDERPGDSLLLLIFLVCVAFACALTGRPSVIDDYAYWAIIGKSIAIFDALPTGETSIFPRHLTYTPGLALVQYFFFPLSGYNLLGSYFVQNLFLVSLLLAITEKQNRRMSFVLISCTVIILILFSGSVFQKLRVDHFLYLVSSVIIWTHIRNCFSFPRFLVIAVTISSLYLIKEVGLVLAFFLLLAIFLDNLAVPRDGLRSRVIWTLLCLLLFFYLLGQKIAWDSYCSAMAFNRFHSGISFDAVTSAFNLTGNSGSRQGFLIFLKSVSLGAADRLNIPYLVWYFVLAMLWYITLKGYPIRERKRYFLLFGLSLPFFLLYLAMNYVMQLVIFGLGTSTPEPTSLDRYVNISFCWFILFTLYSFLTGRLTADKAGSGRTPAVLMGLSGLLLLVSSVPEKPESHETEIEQMLPKLEEHLSNEDRVCITPGNVEHNYLGFRLLYHLFPSRFNVDSFSDKPGKGGLDKELAACDYLLVYLPADTTAPLFARYTTESLEHKSLFKIVSRDSEPGTPLKLERVY